MNRRTMIGAALLSLSVGFTSLTGCGAGGGSSYPSWLPWQPPIGALTLSPNGSSYVPRKIGTSSPAHIFTLTNPSSNNAAVMVRKVDTTDDQFIVDSATTTCGQNTVPAGGTCQVGVMYRPTRKGAATALLEVTDNASNSPQTANLTGTGR